MNLKSTFLTFTAMLLALSANAQFSWSREKARHSSSITQINLPSPFFRSDYKYVAQDRDKLYERTTSSYLSLSAGIYHTNFVQTHLWSRRDYYESFTVTNGWQSVRTDGGTPQWTHLNVYGQHTGSPPADIGSDSWETNGNRYSISAKSSWWITSSPYQTETNRLLLLFRFSEPDYWSDGICYSRYAVTTNMNHYVIVPIISEMRSEWCRDDLSRLNQWTFETFYIPLVRGGWQDWSDQWGKADGNDNICPAHNTSGTISTTIPDPDSFPSSWTAANDASSMDVDIEESGEAKSYSPPPPGDDGNDGDQHLESADDGHFKLVKFIGSPGRMYMVDYSTNLVDWSQVGIPDEYEDGQYKIEHRQLTPYKIFYRIQSVD